MKRKKTVVFLLMVVLIMAFIGCSQCNTECDVDTTIGNLSEPSSKTLTLIDKTIKVEDTFDISDESVIQTTPIHACFTQIYPNLESIYDKAENVVVGTVIEVQYTDEDAKPRTIYSFQISEVLKGDIMPNTLISVAESNGYVRLSKFIEKYGADHFENLTEEEITNSVFLQSIEGAPLAAEGETYVAFLSEKKTEGQLAGAYVVIGNFMGKYVLNTASKLYERFTPSTDPEFYVVEASNGRTISAEQPMSLDEIKSVIDGIA